MTNTTDCSIIVYILSIKKIREKYGSPESYPYEGEWNQGILIRANRELKSDESENSDQVIQIIANKHKLCKQYKLVMN